MTLTASPIHPGMTFRAPLADGNPLFRVERTRGDGVWECVVQTERFESDGRVYEGGDFVGEVRYFSEDQILRQINLMEYWRSSARRAKTFWNSVQVGEVYHYDNGFGQFVRCVVTPGPDGTLGLQPIALVGNWVPMDLPRYNRDGSVHLPYHAEKVVRGTGWWRPSESTIFENPSYRKSGSRDPRKFAPIDLSLQEPSPEMKRQFRKEALRNSIRKAAEMPDVDQALRLVRELAAAIDSES